METQKVKTDIYPLDDLKKKAKVEEAAYFFIDEVRELILNNFRINIAGPKFGGAPKPSEDAKKDLIERLCEGLKNG